MFVAKRLKNSSILFRVSFNKYTNSINVQTIEINFNLSRQFLNCIKRLENRNEEIDLEESKNRN